MTRQRYLRQLAKQARTGDVGAKAALFAAIARDSTDDGLARFCCEAAIRSIRQLRQSACEAEAWIRRQLEGLRK